MDKGREAASSSLHVQTEWAGPPHSQAAEQKNLMEEYADKGFNCMAVSCVEASTIGPVIDDLTNRGMKIITFDSDAPDSKRLIYIGTDNFQSGIVAGQQMVKLLPEGGEVWGFVGNISAENARDRRDGFLKAVLGHKI
jgi:ribose transport system substrate-binding protein